jgi:hypothetical protein
MQPEVLQSGTKARPRAEFTGGTVPVPNALFDGLLPTLRDTELRVLLVVIRATVGWRDRQGRVKARDWISHGQLVKRTGRGSEAVSGAVDRLVRYGLIVVEDAAGRLLCTPAERRRYLGRVYYRLGENLGKTPGLSHPAKPKRTTDNENKNKKQARCAC